MPGVSTIEQNLTASKELQRFSRLKVSVISLFYNRRDVSRGFVNYWRLEKRRRPDVELIFGDSGSTDGTRSLLKSCAAWARVRLFDANPGYSAGNNRLAEEATGEILVFLNNDTLPCGRWLDEILAVFGARPDAGIVGNIQLSVGNRLVDHAGVFFDNDGKPEHFRPPAGALNNLRWMPVPAVTGACLAIRRSLFVELGGFDQSFSNGYEDTDLCLRARRVLKDILVSTRSHIWHYVASSPGRHEREEQNARLFHERWEKEAQRLKQWQRPRLAPGTDGSCSALREDETIQVFLPSAKGFNEEESVRQIVRSKVWTRCEFDLEHHRVGYGGYLRIDPGQRPGVYSLAGVSFRAKESGRLLWQRSGKALANEIRLGGTATSHHGEAGVSIRSDGGDPQWLLMLPPPVLESKGTCVTTLWIHVEPDQPVHRPPTTAPGTLTVLVDLCALAPQGASGGVKVLIWETLSSLINAAGTSLVFTLLHESSLDRELSEAFPSIERVSPDQVPEDRLWNVLYAPLGRTEWRHKAEKSVGVVVDLLHRDRPDLLPEAEVFHRERLLVELLAHASVIQCNSLFVRGTLTHHYGVGEMALFVAYNALQHRLRGISRREGRDYFLYPANTWTHKNHRRLLEAYQQYRASTPNSWRLILTGTRVGGENDGLPAEVPLPEGVEWKGFLEEQAYQDLLASAGALVFPSLYEGFGIPVLEALTLGVPVACSREGSLPEVGGNDVLYFDGHDTRSIAEALARLAELASPGKAPKLDRFDWTLTVDRILRALGGQRDYVVNG